MGVKNTKFDGSYATIGADGEIRIPAQPNEPGAVLRQYETTDGKTGEKWEKVYTEISGKITGINFFDGNFGKVLNLIIDDGSEKFSLSVSTQSTFAEDLMKKLPNVDFAQEVLIKPYSFVDKTNNKSKKGCSVIQGENKIASFFTKEVDGGKYEVCNDYPAVPSQTMDKEDWKIYFLQARKFLVGFIEQNIIPVVESMEIIPGMTKQDEEAIDTAIANGTEPEEVPGSIVHGNNAAMAAEQTNPVLENMKTVFPEATEVTGPSAPMQTNTVTAPVAPQVQSGVDMAQGPTPAVPNVPFN